MENLPPIELLESTHSFPGAYQIKAIGVVADDFEARVLEAVRRELPVGNALDYKVRTTPGGRHVALTLVVFADNAEQVRQLYARIHEQAGLLYLL